MKMLKVSDELFEQLKGLVVDPFDDTPDLVIGRLIEIVNKAKGRWSPLEPQGQPEMQSATTRPHSAREPIQQDDEVVLL
jgi:hypothetical protein